VEQRKESKQRRKTGIILLNIIASREKKRVKTKEER
jgi:hypothetical protein